MLWNVCFAGKRLDSQVLTSITICIVGSENDFSPSVVVFLNLVNSDILQPGRLVSLGHTGV